MIQRRILFIIFFFVVVNSEAQNNIFRNETLSYISLETNGVVKQFNKSLFYPSSGYYDFINNMPIYQRKIAVNYNVSRFEYTEEIISNKEFDFYKDKISNSNFTLDTRKQEGSLNNTNQVVLISCLRKSEDKIYRLKSVNLKLSYQKPENGSIKSALFLDNSMLSDGSKWFKFRNYKDGIYKIDYDFLINNNLISGDINSNSIHLFANNKGLLRTVNDDHRVDDLVHHSIYLNDGGDGVFSNGDYILLFLNSANREQWNGENFTHTNHIYSDSAYFFLNINPNRLPNNLDSANHLSQSFNQTITSFKQFEYIEDDQINLLKSGSQWLGDVFDLNNNYNYSFPFNNIQDSSNVRIKVVSKSNFSSAIFNVSLFGVSNPIPISSSGSSYYSPVGRSAIVDFDYINTPGQEFTVNLNYNNNGSPSSVGYLDFIEVNCKRELSVDNPQFDFFIPAVSSGLSWSKVILKNANSVGMIWDITDLTNIKKLQYNNVNGELSFTVNLDTIRHFVAVTGSSFQTPEFLKEVISQNLHGLETPEMIIVSPIELRESAEKLKEIHQNEGLNAIVVTDEEIYNEFSGGIPDATAIKQFLRMFYVRENGNPMTVPKYCLLFGDGTYDNKNILGHGKNFLPVFESSESLSVTSTYASDDYYAILSDGASMLNTDLLNIAVGRLTVDSKEMADDLIDKIKDYIFSNDSSNSAVNCSNNTSPSVLGSWRNKVVLVSDDEDNNAYFNDIEIMSNKIEQQKKQMNITKIHSDAYAQQSSAVGEIIPDAKAAIDESVSNGALVVNYIGHGGETGWAHEGILDVETIKSWENLMNMPVFMTATCEFGRFDDHDRVSAGEYILNNTDGAGIGLFTTTRLVYANPNEDLNNYFYDTVFDLVANKAQRLGDIYVGTKNKFALYNADPNYRKFAFLGDPAIKLALPEKNVAIDSFNRDTVSALSEVVVYGHLEDSYTNKLSDFNGIAYLTFFDKKSLFNTLGTNPGSSVASYQMWKNIIYKGKSTVTNGDFSFSFKVPKDIGYNYGVSRISFYAENGIIDGSGYNDSLIIGGIDTSAVIDERGPDLEMYLNDENFISGGITNNEPLLIVSVFDENGVNTVGNGIGHDIELVVDDDYANSIVLNDYYESDLDTYKSGKINYELNNLTTGEHKLKIKVWDIYNNSSSKEIIFNVVDDQELQLNHVLNYPNPFTTKTEFFFEHNQNCNFLDVSIQIYNVSGKVVKRINKRIHNQGFRSEGILWDGRDDFGEKLAQGVYIYNLRVVNEQGMSSDKTESMFLLK
jgi:hypothetical protein